MKDVPGWKFRKITRAEVAQAVARSALIEQRVLHDDWCPRLSGGKCGCKPEIEFYEVTPDESTQRRPA